jgi:dihydrofolate reductase
MSMVFASLGMSLGGFIASPNAGPDNALGDGGARIHQWMYRVEAWRERQTLSGGEVNRDAELLEENYNRAGAYVMGRRMFDEGEVGWPDPPPFRARVFVLTHNPREPWERQGGTTFTFVTHGPERARLFDGVEADMLKLEQTRVVESPAVTHVRYRVAS